MIITGYYLGGIAFLKNHPTELYKMKDLDHLCYFLGIKVASSARGYVLSQIKYALDNT